MRLPNLSSFLLIAALTSAPSLASWVAPPEAAPAGASPAALAQASAQSTAAPAPDEDVARYAAREARNPEAARFRGGSTVLAIGGSTVTVVLLVVLLVILL